jgi:hypothetical protein
VVASRRERGEHTYLAFLDLARAYDSMWRDGGWLRLLQVGVHGKMWRMVRATYREARHHVRVNGHVSESFDTYIGVRQGAVLSPLLFSLFLAGVVRAWRRAGLGVQIGKRRVGGLLFADDIVLIAASMEELKRALAVMDEHARLWRYTFNQSKCAVVVMMARKLTGESYQLQGQPVPESLSYKYQALLCKRGIHGNNGMMIDWRKRGRVRCSFITVEHVVARLLYAQPRR